ncbi:MAG: HypC/HybG/HupF family hydrogenase formation chaperone [Acidimicrobiales bacterium]
MNALSQGPSGPDAADLAAASLAMARRFASGATLWCAMPSRPWRARQVAVELAQPEIAGGRCLPAVTVPGQLLESLRTHARAGDVLLLVAGSDEPSASGLRQRTAAWGVLTVWIGTGPRPLPGAADYVLWVDDDETISSYDGRLVPVYRLLRKMTHDRLEHPELLGTGQAGCDHEVCITCSDEGRLGEVVTLRSDGQAQVRTPTGVETVDTSLVDGARAGDLVLIHAGAAVSVVTPERWEPEEAP